MGYKIWTWYKIIQQSFCWQLPASFIKYMIRNKKKRIHPGKWWPDDILPNLHSFSHSLVKKKKNTKNKYGTKSLTFAIRRAFHIKQNEPKEHQPFGKQASRSSCSSNALTERCSSASCRNTASYWSNSFPPRGPGAWKPRQSNEHSMSHSMKKIFKCHSQPTVLTWRITGLTTAGWISRGLFHNPTIFNNTKIMPFNKKNYY